MTQKLILTGTADTGNGDPIRTAFTKVNENFTELYTALGLDGGGLNLGAFEFTGSTMTTTDSTAIVIDQATTVTSNLSVGGDILPQTANGGNLGSSTLPWRSLYVSNNTIFIGNTSVGVDANGNLTTNGSRVGAFSFSVAADDSTQRLISSGELVKFIGAGGVTTASDAEGNITINYVQGDIRSEGNINIDINLSDSTLRRWRFGEDGLLTFPDGTNQSTAWTGSTTVSSLVNGANTLGLGSTGTLTLPEGSTIDESLEIVTVTLDQFTDGGFPGTRVFTKTSDTLYELSPGGPYMTLISGIWRLKVGPSTYYDSTDLVTWGTIAGGLPTPVGTLTTVVTTNLTVGGDVWGFDGNGALTFPDATTQTTAYTGIPGPYADDEAAALAGVALGSPYHKTGTGGQVFVRLTSPT